MYPLWQELLAHHPRYLDQEHAYQFILEDFATLEDWRLILEWLSSLARQLGNEIHDNLGTSYDADSIFSFDYENYLLKNLQNLEKDPDLININFRDLLIL